MRTRNDYWQCCECGQAQGKHDQYFDGICESCHSEILTNHEQDRLNKYISDFKRELGLNNISGGFVIIKNTEIFKNEIELTIKFGTQDENGDYSSVDTITLDRNTFKQII